MSNLRTLVRSAARRSELVQDAYERRKNRKRLPILERLLPEGGAGAELGVHKGHLTPVLLEAAKPSHLYVVDPWFKLEAEWDWAAGDRSTVHAYARVVKRLRTGLEDGSVSLIVDDDRNFLSSLPDRTLDWVYVDSSHQYEHTREELALLIRKVVVGGVIAGDDWQEDPGHRHHGVCRAVREAEIQGSVKIKYASNVDHQWAALVVG